MTASVATVATARTARVLGVPHLLAIPRSALLFILAGAGLAATVVLAPALSQAVLLLAGPAAVLWLISRAALDDDLDAHTLRITLGLPRPID